MIAAKCTHFGGATRAARVHIVIVNYRVADLTIECLRSLEAEVTQAADARIRVTVVDNASDDDSAAKLQATIAESGWQAWASVLPLARNGGFAFGNNAAIRSALGQAEPPDYVMLLNPDTVVRPMAVTQLVCFLQSHPRVGIVGSGIEDTNGWLQCSAHNFPTPWTEFDAGAGIGVFSRLLRNGHVSPSVQEKPHRCQWVSGASLMVRRQVFEQIGLLDEGFFLYFEEVDFCRRARRAGWEVWYVPSARVLHLEGESTGARGAGRRPRYWFDSRRRYFAKHYGPLGLATTNLLWALGRSAAAVWGALKRHPGSSESFSQLFRNELPLLIHGSPSLFRKPTKHNG